MESLKNPENKRMQPQVDKEKLKSNTGLVESAPAQP